MLQKMLFLIGLLLSNLAYSVKIYVKPYYDRCYMSGHTWVEIDPESITIRQFKDEISDIFGGYQIIAFRLAFNSQAFALDMFDPANPRLAGQSYFDFKNLDYLLKDTVMGDLIIKNGQEKCALSVVLAEDSLLGIDEAEKAELRLKQLKKVVLQQAQERGLNRSSALTEFAQLLDTYDRLIDRDEYGQAVTFLEGVLRERGFNLSALDDYLSAMLNPAEGFFLEEWLISE